MGTRRQQQRCSHSVVQAVQTPAVRRGDGRCLLSGMCALSYPLCMHALMGSNSAPYLCGQV